MDRDEALAKLDAAVTLLQPNDVVLVRLRYSQAPESDARYVMAALKERAPEIKWVLFHNSIDFRVLRNAVDQPANLIP